MKCKKFFKNSYKRYVRLSPRMNFNGSLNSMYFDGYD